MTHATPGIASASVVSIRDDPGVRELGAQHLAVQHARHLDVAGERRLAAHLRVGVAPVDRAADLGEELIDGRAHGGSRRSRAAARIDW